ncbi:MAG: sensor histidine kinase [Dehalococcoidia bacterium]
MLQADEARPPGTMARLERALSERLGMPRAWAQRAGAAADVAIAAGLFAAGVVALATSEPGTETATRTPDAFAYVLGTMMTLPLAVRRRWPLWVLWTALAGHMAFNFRDYAGVNVDFFGPVVAVYTVSAYRPRRVSVPAAAAALLGVFVADPPFDEGAGNFVATVLIIVGIWLFGDTARTRRVYGERLAAQAEALREARMELAEQAVSQERLRIARELHDVVAHHMSAIVVQSALAQDRLEADAPAARRAMGQVEQIGRSALREMRQILGVLRQEGEERGALDPSPSLGDLERVYEQGRAGGLRVDASTGGELLGLSPAVELAAFRIVQEALTNAMKHAPGSAVRVRIERGAASLRVEVRDDGAGGGRGAPRRPRGSGQGLVGMRERVVLLGGEFEAGPAEGGGFRVAATLPLEGAA